MIQQGLSSLKGRSSRFDLLSTPDLALLVAGKAFGFCGGEQFAY